MDFHFLFPVGAHEKPPTEAFVSDYDAALGQFLSQDGVLYYTDDPSVIRYRGELFGELLEDDKLLSELRNFAAHFTQTKTEGGTPSELLKGLTAYKGNMKAFQCLTGFFAAQSFCSAPWNRIKKDIMETAESVSFRKAVKILEKIPEELLQIKSITLGINLDSVGNAHDAGIVSLNPYYFVSDHPLEKSVRLGAKRHPTVPLLKQERGQNDSFAEWNRELMGAVDRLLCKKLKKLHIDYKAIIHKEIGFGEDWLNELLFVVEFAHMLTKLRQYGAEISCSNGNPTGSDKSTVHIGKMLTKIKLGYDAPMIADSEGVWRRTLAVFGVNVLMNKQVMREKI